MGLFDAVRSLFGSEKAEEPDSDASATDASADETATDRQTEGETADSAAAVPEGAPEEEADSEPGGQSFETDEAGETDHASEASGSDEREASDTDDEDAAGDTDDEEEKISWEETGFEQLTTELVEDDEEEEEAAADLIEEAEPDREASAESDTASTESEPEPGASAETPDDAESAEEPTGSGPNNLPLDEQEAEAMTEGEDSEADVDVPPDSPRAEFVEEAADLAEFWGEYDLDFTVESLTQVDEMIAEQWGPERFEDVTYGGEDYDSEVFTGLVRQVGSYLGEVFVRVHGGEWVKQEGIGWTVDVPAGEGVDAAGATVTVFHIAQQALTGEATVAGKHDALAAELGLEALAGGDAETAVVESGDTVETSALDDDDLDAAARLEDSAADLAERWPDYELDFTTASLSRLEALIEAELDAERFEGVELGDESDQDSMLLTAHAVGVGGYLAAVLRREHDAAWATDGRMVLLVEREGETVEIDPIDVAVECLRGERSLTAVVPE